ncbi:protein arginine N-methyltransferase 9-like [Dendronephthya gigantea]|uniref:protein arginine N-methyltransferase 9-like n=1 Tax=Dendronephthya gigantea TaxID=151771 RepID=UPI00106993C5|nr:protein arginine N-methyltransferase 9-like [Dendronephthya gigantea]
MAANLESQGLAAGPPSPANLGGTKSKSTCNSNSSDRKGIPGQAEEILDTANELLLRKDYGKALSYFAYIVHTIPLFRDQVHDDFLFALKSWSGILAEHNKAEDLVKCLREASRLFPDSAEIANIVGSTLFQLNMFDEAALNFRRALKLDPQHNNAAENLDSIANLLVERWHFRMLNDKGRNEAYRNAINRSMNNGCNQVLDIGSGTCILSMFAIQSGAKEVYACEMSKTMYDLSLDILMANQMRDSIHIINKKSQDLTIPEDMPEKVSLIVTETLDCGLLGEGIIDTLTHAKQELLTSNQKTQIIPESAMVYGQLIQCEKIKNYSRVKKDIFSHDVGIIQIHGAEMSEKGTEPYTTEEMSCVEHTTLSEPFHITSYDFQTPEKYICEATLELTLPVVRSGCLDAIMVWFELRLDPHETLSSAPGCSVCWEQAVYPCQLLESERSVKTGEKVSLNVRLVNNAIYLEVQGIARNPNFTLAADDTAKSMPCQRVCKSSDLQVTEHDLNSIVGDHISMVLPYQDISKLNDTKFTEICNEALSDAFEKLKILPTQDLAEESTLGCIVLCSSPSFNPLFAIWSRFSPVVCLSNNKDFMQCLNTIAGQTGKSEDLCFFDKPLEELAGTKGWGILIVDPVEPGGQLRQGVIEDIVLAKGCVLCEDTGIVLPRRIEVWGMLISSSSLCQKSLVTSKDVTLGLNIAGFMNTFQVVNQIDVDVKSNPFDTLTVPEMLLAMDFSKPHDDESLLSLLNITCEKHVTACKEGIADGLMYWFELGYIKDSKISTGPDSGCQFNQVVIMFKEKVSVIFGQKFLVKTSCKNSCIMASVRAL